MIAGLDMNDTIAAIASPPGPAARGIVRLSGPIALDIALERFESGDGKRVMLDRRAISRDGRLSVDGLRPFLPASISLWPAPRTYTGQNIAEIHAVGATPLLSAVLAHCLARGARLAEPGEFTLRAFLSGRIDLTRAEAVLGVIDAHSPAQLDAALAQLAGGLANPITAARDRLLDMLAHLEANLDFMDEPDVSSLGRAAMLEAIAISVAELTDLAGRLSERDRPEALPRVVLVGPPNVGKSRLFNALAGDDHAIVSPQAGTTRDYLAACCDCNGLAVELIDTAGIEPARDSVMAQAQSFGASQAAAADLILECRTSGLGAPVEEHAGRQPTLQVLTKADLSDPLFPPREGAQGGDGVSPGTPIVTSAATGEGINTLRSAIARALCDREGRGDLPAGTSARCRGSLRAALDALRSAQDTLVGNGGDELIAIDLRRAVDELGKIVGLVVTDDILDRIFRRFCIGK